jgi:tetratricopeptide (TPR) repeat protein
MFSKKNYCALLLLCIIQLKAQTHQIQIPFLGNSTAKIEALLLQEKSFDNDTLSLKKYLQPLHKSKEYAVVYEALLANGYSDFYDKANSKSKFYYLQSIKKAEVLKVLPIEIWTQLNYISYLYQFRDYGAMTPILLQVIEKLKKLPTNEIILSGETFKKIGWILQSLGDYPGSLHYLNLAKKNTPEKSSEYATILDNIGLNYFNLGNIKAAESYFNRTALLAKEIKDEVRYAKVLGNLALIEKQRGNFKSAISLIKRDIEISERKQSNQNTMYASILLAELYIANKNLDQAEEVLTEAQSIACSKLYFEKSELQIIKLKLEILHKRNKTDNELELRRRMLVLENSLKNKDGDMAISKANWIIQKTKFQQKINKAKDQFKHESKMNKIYSVIILLTVLLAVVLFFSFRKQLKNRHFEYKQKVSSLEFEKIKNEHKLTEAQENLKVQNDYLKDKNFQIKKLEIEKDLIKKSSSGNLEKGKLNALLESHLMTDNNWNTFKREFQKEHPEFYQLLHDDFPEITDSNKRILLLQKLDLNTSEIAELLGITTEAVKKSRQRLKKKLGTKFNILLKYLNNIPESVVD